MWCDQKSISGTKFRTILNSTAYCVVDFLSIRIIMELIISSSIQQPPLLTLKFPLPIKQMLYMVSYSLIDIYKCVGVCKYMNSQNSVTTPLNSDEQIPACQIDQNLKSYNFR